MLMVARPADHAGQQRTGQGEVGAQRDAAGDTHGGEGGHVARLQQGSPDEGRDREQHGSQPTARQAEAAHRAHPQRHRERRRGEVREQEHRLPCRGIEPVAHEKQHQCRGHGARNAVQHEDDHQSAEGGRLPGQAKRHGGTCTRRGGRRCTQQQQPDRQQHGEGQHRHAQPHRGGQHAGGQHAGQRERLAPADDACPLRFAATEHRAPGLVRDTGGAVREIGHPQQRTAPCQHGRPRGHRRKEQTGEPRREHEAGEGCAAPRMLCRSLEQPIDATTDPGIDACVEQPGRQQHRAERRKRHAEGRGVVRRQQHVER